jgi:hypothetical protein
VFLVNGAPSFWRSLGELEQCIRSGQSSFDCVFGQDFFEYLGSHSDEESSFSTWMNYTAAASVPAILGAWNFSRYQVVVDVGGGRGALLAGILFAYPGLRGVLYDLPVVTADTPLKSGSFTSRCEVISGSFFESVPDRGDLYILRAVLHNWNDEKSLAILRNCRCAMKAGSTLLIVERMLAKGDLTELTDLLMFAVSGGMERTLPEYNALLSQSGFRFSRVVPTAGPAIIEAFAE